jgi:hypothetical protein
MRGVLFGVAPIDFLSLCRVGVGASFCSAVGLLFAGAQSCNGGNCAGPENGISYSPVAQLVVKVRSIVNRPPAVITNRRTEFPR